jgi:ComF family protein
MPEELDAHLQTLPATHGVFDTVFALWHFDKGGTLQAVQHALKYGHRPRYGRILGEWMGQALAEQPHRLPSDALILPVPLHRVRQLERGYNQSAMLAAGLSRHLGLPAHEDLLRRHRATHSQTRLSRTRRWQNVEGAFVVTDPSALAERPVLLVDDVLTTGATVAAAAWALKQAGAREVHLAALALAR